MDDHLKNVPTRPGKRSSEQPGDLDVPTQDKRPCNSGRDTNKQKSTETAETTATTATKRSEPKTTVQKRRRDTKKQKSNATAETTAATTTERSEPKTTKQQTERPGRIQQSTDQAATPTSPSARAAKRPREEGDEEAPRPSKITKYFFPRARQDRPP
jgi:hypothetical protein